ncbi:MAG: cupin domain-containing protein [Firmicutes bacterium]|nr:cupin domain-containing protein [Bacillota bacterium]
MPAAGPPPPFTVPLVVPKPWGREVWWAESPSYLGKTLEVRAGHRLSLQYHRLKLETLHFVRGEGLLVLGEADHPIISGTSVTIPPGVPHRLVADTDLVVLEVSTAHPDDVVRLEDAYGRVIPPTASGGSPPPSAG